MKDFKVLMNGSEYDFLRDNERLGKRIILPDNNGIQERLRIKILIFLSF